MCAWRKLTEAERAEALRTRIARGFPWHAPPTTLEIDVAYHLTAACLNHAHVIGRSPGRMTQFEGDLLELLRGVGVRISAGCVLPNHYHLLVDGLEAARLKALLGRLHGRSSRAWNLEERALGRQV